MYLGMGCEDKSKQVKDSMHQISPSIAIFLNSDGTFHSIIPKYDTLTPRKPQITLITNTEGNWE